MKLTEPHWTLDPKWTITRKRGAGGSASVPSGGGLRTTTRPMPITYTRQVQFDDGERVEVALTIDVCLADPGGSRDGVVVGVSSIEVTTIEPKDWFAKPLTAGGLGRLPIRELLVHAIQQHATNSDRSEVTRRQALRLMRGAERDGSGPEARWRIAAEAHLDALEAGKPTAIAVARALGLGTGKEAQDKARQFVRRSRQKRVYYQVEAERGAVRS